MMVSKKPQKSLGKSPTFQYRVRFNILTQWLNGCFVRALRSELDLEL